MQALRISVRASTLEIAFTLNRNHCVFLDMRVSVDPDSRDTNKLRSTVYFKPNHTFSYLSPKSNHHVSAMKGLVKTECIRYARLCSKKADFIHATTLFKLRLLKLGYTRSFIRKNSVNYDEICRCTLRYKGKRNRELNGTLLCKLIFDRKIRLDKVINRIINKASLRTGVDTRQTIIHILQPKLRELISSRKMLHDKLK